MLENLGPTLLRNLTYIPFSRIHNPTPEFICQKIEAYSIRGRFATFKIQIEMKIELISFLLFFILRGKIGIAKMCNSFGWKSNMWSILGKPIEVCKGIVCECNMCIVWLWWLQQQRFHLRSGSAFNRFNYFMSFIEISSIQRWFWLLLEQQSDKGAYDF